MTLESIEAMPFDAELRGVLMRFEADVRLVCEALGDGRLYRRVTEAFRLALTTAAGVPTDPIWRSLVAAVAELLSSATDLGDAPGRAAVRRLTGVLTENSDLLLSS
jgi:hypothetical protein